MKTTKSIIDEEWENVYLTEQAIILAEREQWEKAEMQSIMEQDAKIAGKYAKVLLGKARKRDKFTDYAKISVRKIPRIIKYLQHK